MSVEQIVYAALSGLAGGAIYPDVAPAQTPPPWVTYQAVGGQAFSTVSASTPATRNARVQLTVWANTRLGAATLMEQVFQALVNPSVKAVPLGAPVSMYESDTLLYGSRLDFSIIY